MKAVADRIVSTSAGARFVHESESIVHPDAAVSRAGAR